MSKLMYPSYEGNKEKLIDIAYRHENKEKISEYQKEYRSENKEATAEYSKQWYSENKEKLKAKRSVKVTCECGCSIRKNTIVRHKRSQKHIDMMSQLQQSV